MAGGGASGIAGAVSKAGKATITGGVATTSTGDGGARVGESSSTGGVGAATKSPGEGVGVAAGTGGRGSGGGGGGAAAGGGGRVLINSISRNSAVILSRELDGTLAWAMPKSLALARTDWLAIPSFFAKS
jgi:hypothetical protein